MISTFTAVFDANVFFGARLRSLIIELAQSGIFRARWSAEINNEWMRNVAAKRGIAIEKLQVVAGLMERAVPDCLVTGHERMTLDHALPDPNDEHVLAAAIQARASAIVTFNTEHFPEDALAPHGLHCVHPDDFLLDVESISSQHFIRAIKRDIEHYIDPPLEITKYLDDLSNAGIPKVAAYLLEREVLLRR